MSNCRFEEVRKLVKDPSLRVTDIAKQTGYNKGHVSRLRKEATKKEWVGLTNEEIEDEWEKVTGHSIFGGDRKDGRTMYISPDEVVEFAKTIETKLKEKNG